MSQCSKPGCNGTGTVLLGYDYRLREATLDLREAGPLSPHLYVMCSTCADKLTPPRGWQLIDNRPSYFPTSLTG